MGGDNVSEPKWHLSRDGKTYGPVSDTELHLLIENGKIKSDDLIWRDGFEDWRPANTVLSRASPPPIPKKAPIQRARSKGRAWKWGLGATLVMSVVAALYVASPYYTLWRLKQAIENKDSLALENLVDWPRIREQVKSQILAATFTSTLKTGDGFGVLGTALGAAMVGPLIDSFVQPASIIRASDNNPNFADKIKGLDVWSGYFIGATAFQFDLEGPPPRFGDDPTKLGLIFEFQAPGWRVTHIDIPSEQIAALKEQSATEQSSTVGMAEDKPSSQTSSAVFNVESCKAVVDLKPDFRTYSDDHVKNWTCRVGRAAQEAIAASDRQAAEKCTEAMSVLKVEFERRFPGQDPKLTYNSSSKLC